MDSLCAEQEKVMIRLEKSGVQGDLGPLMNEEQDPQVWLDEPGSPVASRSAAVMWQLTPEFINPFLAGLDAAPHRAGV